MRPKANKEGRPTRPTTVENRVAGENAEYRTVFAYNLIAARNSRGLTQVGLAEISGISQPHLSRLESGKVEATLSTIIDLVEALRISPSSLVPRARNRRDVLNLLAVK